MRGGIIGVWIEIGGGSVFCGVVRQKARQTSSQTFVPGISRHSFCRECWGLAWGVEEGIWEPGITRGTCMQRIQDVLKDAVILDSREEYHWRLQLR